MTIVQHKIIKDKKVIGFYEVDKCKYCGNPMCPYKHSERAHEYIGDGKFKLKGDYI
jgi:hypothetical protein